MIASDENLDEIASRAEQIYERDIRPHVEPGHEGEFVVVNADTGEYEIDSDAVAAS